ncbi:MAG: hypothetical protein ACTSXQ_06270 [Alphaproteobacteria bacterium]
MLMKRYFSLAEVCDEWNISLPDIRYYIETEAIKCGIKLHEVLVRFYKERFNDDMAYNLPCKQEVVSGVFYIPLKDAHRLFRSKELEISKFETEDERYDFIALMPPEKRIKINLEDLIITRIQCERFEKSFEVKRNKQPLRILNENFERIEYHGKQYSFGQMQAKVFRELFEAAKTENPWVIGKRVMIDNGSMTTHLKALFRNKGEIYRELILSDNKGKYRLNI